MQKKFTSIILFFLTILFYQCNVRQNKISDGDIIFQTDTSTYSKAIRAATHSQYSHCGIIFQENGNYFVYEAIGHVKKTSYNNFIARNKGLHYVIKRLRNSDKILTSEVLNKMQNKFKAFEGLEYDEGYNWSDDRLYCSELVWKIYYYSTGLEIGNTQYLKEFDLSSKLVMEKVKESFGDSIPYEEFFVSPEAIFQCKLLYTVDSL
ncbi:MAG TPA: YiiX family permuted papain-like enzyme [Bacteroidales bacterium]|nr:YiiX family permuted papain-like enzyme [Bacteroidales bacterium]HPS16925.1 YiiX family permuted papain-like enzyme [Bacteroidales bacterium]